LIDLLYKNINNKIFHRILDIGTGTGFTSEILLSKNKNSNFVLNDIAEKMLLQSQTKFHHQNNFQYIPGDIENQNTQNNLFSDHHYDLIVSSLSLQWVNNLEMLLKKILDRTKILAFTTLYKDTFQEITNNFKKNNLSPPTNDYPSFEDLSKMASTLSHEKKISIMKKQYFIKFKNFYEYKKYIIKLGAGINFNKNSNHNLNYDSNCPINLNYNVFFCIIF
jgi:ubiquinone/menaquinone biosynthesis C-methylase UbiE